MAERVLLAFIASNSPFAVLLRTISFSLAFDAHEAIATSPGRRVSDAGPYYTTRSLRKHCAICTTSFCHIISDPQGRKCLMSGRVYSLGTLEHARADAAAARSFCRCGDVGCPPSSCDLGHALRNWPPARPLLSHRADVMAVGRSSLHRTHPETAEDNIIRHSAEMSCWKGQCLCVLQRGSNSTCTTQQGCCS